MQFNYFSKHTLDLAVFDYVDKGDDFLSCVFCDIIAGKIAAKKIYETDDVLAFFDTSPQAPVHFLVVFKKHIESVSQLKPEQFNLVSSVFKVIVEVAKQLKLNDNFRIVNNSGELAGQTVKHVHFHVLSGRKLNWPPG